MAGQRVVRNQTRALLIRQIPFIFKGGNYSVQGGDGAVPMSGCISLLCVPYQYVP